MTKETATKERETSTKMTQNLLAAVWRLIMTTLGLPPQSWAMVLRRREGKADSDARGTMAIEGDLSMERPELNDAARVYSVGPSQYILMQLLLDAVLQTNNDCTSKQSAFFHPSFPQLSGEYSLEFEFKQYIMR